MRPIHASRQIGLALVVSAGLATASYASQPSEGWTVDRSPERVRVIGCAQEDHCKAVYRPSGAWVIKRVAP